MPPFVLDKLGLAVGLVVVVVDLFLLGTVNGALLNPSLCILYRTLHIFSGPAL